MMRLTMKTHIRRLSAVLTALLILMPCASAYAAQTTAQLNKGYWSLQSAYESALNAGVQADIARTGDAILNLFVGAGNPSDLAANWLAEKALEVNIVYATAMNVLDAYEKMGDDAGVLRTLNILQPFAVAYQAMNNKPDAFVLNALGNKRAYYEVPVDVYVETDAAAGGGPFYNAKHEPKNGVLFGESYTGGKETPAFARSSAALVYVLYETETIEQFDYYIRPLAQSGRVIEVAWNLKNEGQSLAGFAGTRAKIESAARYLAGLGTPVWLRFGGEMNVWEQKADPQQFIDAFRLVADIMHQSAPNVAMLWSPNVIGHIETSYDMFYPGDAYVDWVGVSLYTMKYFGGNKEQTDFTQTLYLTGKYANPIALIAPFITAYGGRKPVMVSEGGVENYSLRNQTDETAFALGRMRLMYAMMPVVYPQIKAMLWFNTLVGSPPARYALSDSAEAKSLYGALVTSPYFIALGKSSAEVAYKKLGEAAVPAAKVTLLTYAPFLTKENVTVTYRVDGNWLGASADVPHKQALDMSALADGAHRLTVEVAAGGQVLRTVEFAVQKAGGSVVISK